MKKLDISPISLLFVLFIFWNNVIVSAQEQKQHFLIRGGGFSYATVADKGMSPLVYSGPALHLLAQFQRKTQISNQSYNFLLQGGTITPNNPITFRKNVNIFNMLLSYDYLRVLHGILPEQFNFSTGLKFDNIMSLRLNSSYSNSALQYDVLSSLGLTARVEYPFELFHRSFRGTVTITQPFIAYTVRPSFSFPVPDGFIEYPDNVGKAIGKTLQLRSWKSFYALSSELALQYMLKNGNALYLGYRWYYYSIESSNRVQAANHLLSFGTMFKF